MFECSMVVWLMLTGGMQMVWKLGERFARKW